MIENIIIAAIIIGCYWLGYICGRLYYRCRLAGKLLVTHDLNDGQTYLTVEITDQKTFDDMIKKKKAVFTVQEIHLAE